MNLLLTPDEVRRFSTSSTWTVDPNSWDGPRPASNVTVWADNATFSQLDVVVAALGISSKIAEEGGFDYDMPARWSRLASSLNKTIRVGSWREGHMRICATYSPDRTVSR